MQTNRWRSRTQSEGNVADADDPKPVAAAAAKTSSSSFKKSSKPFYARSSSISGNLAKIAYGRTAAAAASKDNDNGGQNIRRLDRKFSFQTTSKSVSDVHTLLKRTQSNRDMRPAIKEEEEYEKENSRAPPAAFSRGGLKRTLASSTVALSGWNKSFRHRMKQRAQSFKNLRYTTWRIIK
jgi:hypothetical protein